VRRQAVQTVYFFGKLASANKKEAAEIVRKNGGKVASRLSDGVTLVVIGDLQLLEDDWNTWNDELDAATQTAFAAGTIQIMTETAFWLTYGGQKVDAPPEKRFTAVELARITELPLSIVRRLNRSGLIVPQEQTERLTLFGYEAVLTLKAASMMLNAGLTLHTTEDRLRRLQHWQQHLPLPPHLHNIAVDGKTLLLSVSGGILEHTGQHRIVFDET
jgi:hypothetical protein